MVYTVYTMELPCLNVVCSVVHLIGWSTLTFQGAAASDRGIFYLPCIQGKGPENHWRQGYSVVERSET